MVSARRVPSVSLMVQHILRLAVAAAFAMATVVAAPLITAAYDARDDAQSLDGAAVDQYVIEYLDKTSLPGAAVAITRGTEIVHVAGYGHTSRWSPSTMPSPATGWLPERSTSCLACRR